MEVRIGKGNDKLSVNLIALVHRRGRTYIFGADQAEANAVRLAIPYSVAFNRETMRWEVNQRSSQVYQHGESYVCHLAYFKGMPETMFFVHDTYCMDDPDVYSFPNKETGLTALIDITTPDNNLVMAHSWDDPVCWMVEQQWPEDFIVPDEPVAEGVKGATGYLHEIVMDPNDPNPLGSSPIDPDSDPSDPDELEPEYDERKSVLRAHDLIPLEAQMREAIMETSMVKLPTAREAMETEQFSLSGIYHERTREHHIVGLFREAFPDQLIEVLTLRQLCKRYIQMLKLDACDHIDQSIDRFGPQTSITHLRWMLNEIADSPDQSLTKKHRWFGYVQGLLVVYGYTSVPRERDFTRHFFNGQ